MYQPGSREMTIVSRIKELKAIFPSWAAQVAAPVARSLRCRGGRLKLWHSEAWDLFHNHLALVRKVQKDKESRAGPEESKMAVVADDDRATLRFKLMAYNGRSSLVQRHAYFAVYTKEHADPVNGAELVCRCWSLHFHVYDSAFQLSPGGILEEVARGAVGQLFLLNTAFVFIDKFINIAFQRSVESGNKSSSLKSRRKNYTVKNTQRIGTSFQMHKEA